MFNVKYLCLFYDKQFYTFNFCWKVENQRFKIYRTQWNVKCVKENMDTYNICSIVNDKKSLFTPNRHLGAREHDKSFYTVIRKATHIDITTVVIRR